MFYLNLGKCVMSNVYNCSVTTWYDCCVRCGGQVHPRKTTGREARRLRSRRGARQDPSRAHLSREASHAIGIIFPVFNNTLTFTWVFFLSVCLTTLLVIKKTYDTNRFRGWRSINFCNFSFYISFILPFIDSFKAFFFSWFYFYYLTACFFFIFKTFLSVGFLIF